MFAKLRSVVTGKKPLSTRKPPGSSSEKDKPREKGKARSLLPIDAESGASPDKEPSWARKAVNEFGTRKSPSPETSAIQSSESKTRKNNRKSKEAADQHNKSSAGKEKVETTPVIVKRTTRATSTAQEGDSVGNEDGINAAPRVTFSEGAQGGSAGQATSRKKSLKLRKPSPVPDPDSAPEQEAKSNLEPGQQGGSSSSTGSRDGTGMSDTGNTESGATSAARNTRSRRKDADDVDANVESDKQESSPYTISGERGGVFSPPVAIPRVTRSSAAKNSAERDDQSTEQGGSSQEEAEGGASSVVSRVEKVPKSKTPETQDGSSSSDTDIDVGMETEEGNAALAPASHRKSPRFATAATPADASDGEEISGTSAPEEDVASPIEPEITPRYTRSTAGRCLSTAGEATASRIGVSSLEMDAGHDATTPALANAPARQDSNSCIEESSPISEAGEGENVPLTVESGNAVRRRRARLDSGAKSPTPESNSGGVDGGSSLHVSFDQQDSSASENRKGKAAATPGTLGKRGRPKTSSPESDVTDSSNSRSQRKGVSPSPTQSEEQSSAPVDKEKGKAVATPGTAGKRGRGRPRKSSPLPSIAENSMPSPQADIVDSSSRNRASLSPAALKEQSSAPIAKGKGKAAATQADSEGSNEGRTSSPQPDVVDRTSRKRRASPSPSQSEEQSSAPVDKGKGKAAATPGTVEKRGRGRPKKSSLEPDAVDSSNSGSQRKEASPSPMQSEEQSSAAVDKEKEKAAATPATISKRGRPKKSLSQASIVESSMPSPQPDTVDSSSRSSKRARASLSSTAPEEQSSAPSDREKEKAAAALSTVKKRGRPKKSSLEPDAVDSSTRDSRKNRASLSPTQAEEQSSAPVDKGKGKAAASPSTVEKSGRGRKSSPEPDVVDSSSRGSRRKKASLSPTRSEEHSSARIDKGKGKAVATSTRTLSPQPDVEDSTTIRSSRKRRSSLSPSHSEVHSSTRVDKGKGKAAAATPTTTRTSNQSWMPTPHYERGHVESTAGAAAGEPTQYLLEPSSDCEAGTVRASLPPPRQEKRFRSLLESDTETEWTESEDETGVEVEVGDVNRDVDVVQKKSKSVEEEQPTCFSAYIKSFKLPRPPALLDHVYNSDDSGDDVSDAEIGNLEDTAPGAVAFFYSNAKTKGATIKQAAALLQPFRAGKRRRSRKGKGKAHAGGADHHVNFADDDVNIDVEGGSSKRRKSVLPPPSRRAMVEAIQEHTDTYHRDARANLLMCHQASFSRWHAYMNCGYGLCMYGHGSKKGLLDAFMQYLKAVCQDERSPPMRYVTFQGFDEHKSVQSLLTTIRYQLGLSIKPSRDLVEYANDIVNAYNTKYLEGGASSTARQFDMNLRTGTQRGAQSAWASPSKQKKKPPELYLLVHNIDGKNMRPAHVQEALAKLASQDWCRVMASVDHVNAGLLWDDIVASQFRWWWINATTMEPYIDEILAYGGTTGGKNAATKEDSSPVFLNALEALTPRHIEILKILAKHQLEKNTGMLHDQFISTLKSKMIIKNQPEVVVYLKELGDQRLFAEKSEDVSMLMTTVSIPRPNKELEMIMKFKCTKRKAA